MRSQGDSNVSGGGVPPSHHPNRLIPPMNQPPSGGGSDGGGVAPGRAGHLRHSSDGTGQHNNIMLTRHMSDAANARGGANKSSTPPPKQQQPHHRRSQSATPKIPGETTVHLTRISSPSQLKALPEEFMSSDPDRPLLHVDECDNEYHYYLDPMRRAVFFILLVEMLERFSFYGINYTMTAYLTGEYNDDWNADMPSILASSYVSISTAVAYTTPFIGAFVADNILGEYLTIVSASLACYMPGLVLIALTTVPHLLGSTTFNLTAIRAGLLIFWPVGTGAVKACVNVFGAKQFHPILQSSLIESYYVNFYMCINIGALTGGIVVPLLAQWNVTVAYFVPVCMLGCGVLLFLSGTTRYIRPKPKHDLRYFVRKICGEEGRRSKRSRSNNANNNHHGILIQPNPSATQTSKVGVFTILRLSLLIVPFNIAYSQMATTFILQGTVMENFGVVDAPMMNNVDAFSILTMGYMIGNVLFPYLNSRGMKIPTTYKFAIGSSSGALAVGFAIMNDYRIHRTYEQSGEAITVLWQVFPYFLIGIGEIFAVSAAYELAFTVAPASMKAVASAANLFMVGGLPNALCIVLYNACASWFLNARGEAHISKLEDYTSAHLVNYFWVLEFISLFGVVLNLLPSVKQWVESIEEAAAVEVKSPMSTPNIRKNLMERRRQRVAAAGGTARGGADEETPLIRAQKHANYLKHGDGPELRKLGSMRAGPSMKSVKGKKAKGKVSSTEGDGDKLPMHAEGR